MTIGLIQKGADNTSSWFYRNWSGTDGRNLPSPSTKEKWNPYSVTLKQLSAVPGGPSKDRFLSNKYGWYPYTGNLWSANDELRALSKLSEEIRGHSFDLNVALAEGKQTVELVTGSLLKLAKALVATRHGRIDQAARALGVAAPRHLIHPKLWKNQASEVVRKQRPLNTHDFSAMWLELQYGWMPLYKDIFEAMSAYAAIANDSRTLTVKARAQKVLRQQLDIDSATNLKQKTIVRRQIMVELEELMSTPRSLGLTDPLSVTWELTPMSFVADWFIPIGTYLSLLSMIPQLKGRWCTTTTQITESKSSPTNHVFYGPYYKGASASTLYVEVNRTLPLAVPVPSPEFKPLNKALSLKHVENGIALLHQLSDLSIKIDLAKWRFR